MDLDDMDLDLEMIDRCFKKHRQQGKRRATNVISLAIFVFFALIWFAINIYVFLNKKHMEPKTYIDNFYYLIPRYIRSIIFIIPFTALLMFGYIYLLKGLLTKFLVILGIIYNILTLLAIPTFIVYNLVHKEEMKIAFSLTTFELLIADAILIFLAAYKVIALSAAIKVKLNYPTKIIKESCQALFHFPLLIASILSFFILSLVMFICAINGLEFLVFDSRENRIGNNSIDTFFYIFISIGFFFIVNFFAYFTQAVISDCVATWYWAENKNDVRQVQTIFTSMKRVIWYHLGSIAFASTYIFPMLQAILVLFKIESNHVSTYRDLSNPKSMSFMTRAHLVFRISEFALIHTSVDGHDFYLSAKKACTLALEEPTRFLAVVDTFEGTISTGISTAALVIVGTIKCMVGIGTFVSSPYYFTILLYIMSWLTIMPIYLMLCTSFTTIVMSTLETYQKIVGV